MFKYISKNLLFVATVSPKATGEIGCVTPEESCLVVYLIDTITGRILHRMTHHGSQGPVHAVLSENGVVYHYFNLRAHRYEMSVIEIYDQSRADNKDVLKLVFGKHMLVLDSANYPSDSNIIDFHLEDLQTIKVIGKGGGGVVQLVRHKWVGTLFALKVIQMNIQEEIRKQIVQELKINQASQCLHVVVCCHSFYHNASLDEIMQVRNMSTVIAIAGLPLDFQYILLV